MEMISQHFKLYWWIVVIISSCQNVDPDGFEPVTALPVQDELVAEAISVEGDTELLNPFHILNADDEYLVITEVRENNFVHVFNLPDLQFQYSWGKNGRGPDEFVFFPYFINQKEKELHLYDPILQQNRVYRIRDSTLENLQERSLSYTGQMGQPFNGVLRLNDRLYIADYELPFGNASHEYIALRPGESDSLFTFGDYPTTDLEDPVRYFEFKKTNIAKPDGSRFAALYVNHNKFKIFSSTGETLKAIKIQDPHLEEDRNESENNFLYRYKGWASDSYLYFLGIYTSSDVFNENPDSTYAPFLEIWDWEGQPLYRAHFDRLIHAFTVSEEHGKLYGFSKHDIHHIYEYDMSEIINSIGKD